MTAQAAEKKTVKSKKEKALVIVESPAKSKTIKKILGDGYQIEASFGHVRNLPDNVLGFDVNNDFKPTYVVIPEKKKVVTKRMLLEQVWDDGGNFVEENTLHVTLNRLKKKIEPDPAHPVYVKNVFGLGYTFGE